MASIKKYQYGDKTKSVCFLRLKTIRSAVQLDY